MKLHTIIIHMPRRHLKINLSNDYDIQIDKKTVVIKRQSPQELPSQLKLNIASFHTLFGENGSGKTKILLSIAKAFGPDRFDGHISVLYSYHSRLCMYLAPALTGYEVIGTVKAHKTNDCPLLPSIFYTSSPYEKARRVALANYDALCDVSPKYGDTNRLDGLSLLALDENIFGKFLSHAKMAVSLNLLTMSEIYGRLSALNAYDSDYFSDAERALRDATSKSGGEVKIDSLQLRTLCTLEEHAGNKQSELWPVRLAKIVLEVDKSTRFVSFLPDDALKVSQRQPFDDVLSKFKSSIDPRAYGDLAEIIKTLETLRVELGRTKKGAIERQLPRFKTNLDKLFPDQRGLQRCSDLGLVAFSLAGLSSGETAITIFYAALNGALMRHVASSNPGPFLVLIDEGEMFLHPKWQREYIDGILKLIASFGEIAANAHIFISSHSLIVAADTPPNCLIDIETTKTMNGFGLGPKTLLENVYHVHDLPGDHTNPALNGLSEYFRSGTKKITRRDALLTAQALADPDIRDYLVNKINEKESS